MKGLANAIFEQIEYICKCIKPPFRCIKELSHPSRWHETSNVHIKWFNFVEYLGTTHECKWSLQIVDYITGDVLLIITETEYCCFRDADTGFEYKSTNKSKSMLPLSTVHADVLKYVSTQVKESVHPCICLPYSYRITKSKLLKLGMCTKMMLVIAG